MNTSDFTYHLPTELIAQRSVQPRDASRLMVVDRNSGEMTHRHFFDILDELHAGDVLVLNDTKVFRARLKWKKDSASGELLLLRETDGAWGCLAQSSRRIQKGDVLDVCGLVAQVVEKQADGVVCVAFSVSKEAVLAHAQVYGEVPIPPYISTPSSSLEAYQTVYARVTGSVAAPTSGFHFTRNLIDRLHQKNIQIVFVTLHVGVGTFRPIKTQRIEDHGMHAEYVSVSEQAAKNILLAKSQGRRVIGVGTTVARALESWGGTLGGFEGDVDLFITPGYTFRMIDGLITNFHLPASTLLVLVSSFASREIMLRAYQTAVNQRYRFYSFGDAMFIR